MVKIKKKKATNPARIKVRVKKKARTAPPPDQTARGIDGARRPTETASSPPAHQPSKAGQEPAHLHNYTCGERRPAGECGWRELPQMDPRPEGRPSYHRFFCRAPRRVRKFVCHKGVKRFYTHPLRCLCRYSPGRASAYIRQAGVVLGVLFVIWCRVSSPNSGWRKSLDAQERKLVGWVEANGGTVVAVFSSVGSGWRCSRLREAAALAREHGAVLLAETSDRFIRSHAYHRSEREDALPTDLEYARLVRFTEGVTLMTLLHPDAPAGEAHGDETKRGLKNCAKQKKKAAQEHVKALAQQKSVLLPKILEMADRGLLARRIAEAMDENVSHVTVTKWLKAEGYSLVPGPQRRRRWARAAE